MTRENDFIRVCGELEADIQGDRDTTRDSEYKVAMPEREQTQISCAKSCIAHRFPAQRKAAIRSLLSGYLP